jgi:recombinational DNA repair protein (RecF pathway)
MMIAELTALLLHPHDPHAELYEEFNAALTLAGGEHRLRGLVAYAKAALTETGYGPRFSTCLVCGTAIVSDIPLRYSTRGGVVCPNCAIDGQTIATTGLIALALERLPAPSAILSNPPERVGDLNALRLALELLITHAEAVTERRLRTRGVLAALFSQSATNLST